MKFCRISLCVLLGLLVGWADCRAAGYQVGVGVSVTSGLNVIAGYHNPDSTKKWLQHFGVRLDMANTDALKSAIDSLIESYMDDGVDVGDGVKIDDGKLDAWHTGVLLDYYPFERGWRISGGYVWGNLELDSSIFGEIERAPSQRFYFYIAGDHYYYNGNTFNGGAEIDWNYHGPYLGTGFDLGIFCGFSVFMDVGVVFSAHPARLRLMIPQEQLYIYNKETATWAPVTIPQLDNDIARAQQDANRDLAKLKVFPMLKLGFAYRF